MADHRYITDTNFGDTLSAALDGFHRALTRRWRHLVCRAIVEGGEFPRSISDTYHSPWDSYGVWDYSSPPARAHLGNHPELGGCSYVAWVDTGQEEALSGVSCQGLTGPSYYAMSYTDPATGDEVAMPERIDCGMGRMLALVEDWAWAERAHVFAQLPLFDRHDVAAIEAAYDTFLRLGGELGLQPDGPAAGSFVEMSARDITNAVQPIAFPHGGSQDWWAGWTGLAASRAGSGFFASVIPTVNNQSRIIGSLANLYSERAAIIDKGRRDGLYWIGWATRSLDQTEVVTRDVTGWVVMEGIGMGISVATGWSGVGTAVGAAVALVGFLGQQVGTQMEVHAHDMVAIVSRLNDEIANLNRDIGTLEIGYAMDLNRLRQGIHEVHSYNLELYDLTQNDADGDRDDDVDGDGRPRDPHSFSIDIGTALRVAEHCYKAGVLYADLLPVIAETRQADAHLADHAGHATEADRGLLAVRDLLEQFLQTSSGRYLVAYDQVRAAATAYVEVDTEQKEDFDDILTAWERLDIGEIEVDFDPEAYAGATGRPDWTPYHPHPEVPGGPGLLRPGADDGNYVTDEDE